MRMRIGITALVLVWVFSMSGDLQALSLENMATVVQINSCQNCAGVEQQNLAFILQDINTNNVFIFTPNLTASNEVLMNKIANKDIDIDELLMNLDCHTMTCEESQKRPLLVQRIICPPTPSASVQKLDTSAARR